MGQEKSTTDTLNEITQDLISKDPTGVTEITFKNHDLFASRSEDTLKKMADDESQWNSFAIISFIETTLQGLKERYQTVQQKLLEFDRGDYNNVNKILFKHHQKQIEDLDVLLAKCISDFECVLLERKIALQSTEFNLKKQELANSDELMSTLAWQTFENALLICRTPELIKKISSLSELSTILDTFGKKGNNELAGQELMKLIYQEVIRRINQHEIKQNELYQLSSLMSQFKQYPLYIVLPLHQEYWRASLHYLDHAITTRLISAEQQGKKTPWNIGWAGSSKKIELNGVSHQVPFTIFKIQQEIKTFKSHSRPNDINSPITEIGVITNISNLLKTKNQSRDGLINWLADLFRTLFGMARSEDSLSTYSDFAQVIDPGFNALNISG